MPDDDVSHAVNARLTRLEEAMDLPPLEDDEADPQLIEAETVPMDADEDEDE